MIMYFLKTSRTKFPDLGYVQTRSELTMVIGIGNACIDMPLISHSLMTVYNTCRGTLPKCLHVQFTVNKVTNEYPRNVNFELEQTLGVVTARVLFRLYWYFY